MRSVGKTWSAPLLALCVSAHPALAQDAMPMSHMTYMQHLGARVMPFDLARSRHIFEDLPDGGVMEIVSLDGDPAQIQKIRQHLRKEAEAFGRGDFSDPVAIHGQSMPGLADLRQGAAHMSVAYKDEANGARVRFHTTQPKLQEALRAWFKAQVHDHGPDAMMKP